MRSARSEILSQISSALWMMCLAASLMAYSADERFFSTNMDFAHKIRNEVLAVKEHLRAELIALPANELEMIRDRSHPGIPSLNCDSDPCNLEDCFNQIQAGLHLYEDYLSQIAAALPSFADSEVEHLRRNVYHLSGNIQQQMEETGLLTLTYPQANQVLPNLGNKNWKDVVGSYFILDYLQNFLETTFQTLRHCST